MKTAVPFRLTIRLNPSMSVQQLIFAGLLCIGILTLGVGCQATSQVSSPATASVESDSKNTGQLASHDSSAESDGSSIDSSKIYKFESDPFKTADESSGDFFNDLVKEPLVSVPVKVVDDELQTEPKTDDEKKKIKSQQSLGEMLLFQPLKYPRGFRRLVIEGQRVKFESEDGTKLDGRYFSVKNPQQVLLFCHGNGGNLAGRTKRMDDLSKKHQVAIFLFDYRGYGRSEGKPTIPGVLADGRAAVRKAAELARVKPSEVVIMGRSLGGAVATQLASHFQSRGLIVESSFSSFRDVARHHAGFISGVVGKESLNSVKTIKTYRGPLLISHGTSDGVVPYKQGEALYAAANQPKEFFKIDKGGHNDEMPEGYQSRLAAFLKRL